jgi:uncharacterized protein YozE (UPF0346 family)
MVTTEMEKRKIILVAYKVIRDKIRNEIHPRHTIDLKAMISQFIRTTTSFTINMGDSKSKSSNYIETIRPTIL